MFVMLCYVETAVTSSSSEVLFLVLGVFATFASCGFAFGLAAARLLHWLVKGEHGRPCVGRTP